MKETEFVGQNTPQLGSALNRPYAVDTKFQFKDMNKVSEQKLRPDRESQFVPTKTKPPHESFGQQQKPSIHEKREKT